MLIILEDTAGHTLARSIVSNASFLSRSLLSMAVSDAPAKLLGRSYEGGERKRLANASTAFVRACSILRVSVSLATLSERLT
jgi:hypothetical protein